MITRYIEVPVKRRVSAASSPLGITMLMHFRAFAAPYIDRPLESWPPAQQDVAKQLLDCNLIIAAPYGYTTTREGVQVVERLSAHMSTLLKEYWQLAEIARLNALLAKHGVCTRCSELFEHDYEAPFASCGCKQPEWHELTPHMLAVQRAREVAP